MILLSFLPRHLVALWACILIAAFATAPLARAVGTTQQTITFPALANLVVDEFQILGASSSSGLSVEYEIASGPGEIDGFPVIATGPGLITVRATQPGDDTYAAATPVLRSFTASEPVTPNPVAQAITFPALTNLAVGEGQLLDASASSGLSVTYEVIAGEAVIAGFLITPTAAGVITVRASQDGDATYAAATPVERSFTATDIPPDDPEEPENPPTLAQTITFAPLTGLVVGESQFLDAFSTSGLPVSFELVSGSATIDGILVTADGPGTIAIRAIQPGDDTHLPASPVIQTFLATAVPADPEPNPNDPGQPKENQTIELILPPGVTYGDTDLFLSPSSTSGLPVTLTVVSGPAVIDGDFLALTGAGTVVLRAEQAGDASFHPAPAITRSLTVAKAPLLVTLDEDAVRLVGAANPVFTPSFLGFVGNDGVADLDRLPVAASTAKKNSPPGDYPVTLSGGLDNNYTFDFGSARTLTIVGYGGAYEVLLLDPDTGHPVGKLELTISRTTAAYTGRLTLARETAVIKLKGRLELDFDANAVSELTIALRATKLLSARAYGLFLQLQPDALYAQVLLDDAFLADGTGPALHVLPARTTAPWIGAHTVVFGTPVSYAFGVPFPTGAGHATATIARTGNLSLKGRLADGTALTAVLKPDPAGAYRLFARPYGARPFSQLTGALALQPHPTLADRFLIPAGEGLLFWTKAGVAKDKAYRTGFGPLDVPVTLDPWLPPTKATRTTPSITLAGRLGLAPDPVTGLAPFGLDYLAVADAPLTTDQIDALPAALDLAATGKPVPPSPNPAKFSLKLNAKTGALSGAFVLTDVVPAPTARNPAATKTLTRRVGVFGTLRQPPPSEPDGPVGQGYFLLPPLVTGGEQVSGEFRLLVP